MAKNRTTLTQKKFVKEYIKNNGNAKQAIKAINPNISSDEYACVKGSRMLRNDNVQREIKRKIGEITVNELKQKVLDIINDTDTRQTDRLKAIDMLFKCVGGYAAQKLDVKTDSSISVTLESARKRLEQ